MILLSKIFDDLAYGEFANIAMGKSQLDSITEKHYPRVLSALNLGLTELYKRFKLKEKEFDIHQQTGVSVYYLRTDNMGDVGDLDSETYLVSSNDDDPFADDIIKILEAYDSDGEEVKINFSGDPDNSIFTQAHDIIKMTPSSPLETISIVYQATHPPITITPNFDPKLVKLYFPDFILEALLNFVASRIFKGKTSKAAEGETHLSLTFIQQFEHACRKIVELGLVADEELSHNRFTTDGWA